MGLPTKILSQFLLLSVYVLSFKNFSNPTVATVNAKIFNRPKTSKLDIKIAQTLLPQAKMDFIRSIFENHKKDFKGGTFFYDFVYTQNGFFSQNLDCFLALYQGYDQKSYMRPQINLPKNTLGMISDHYQSFLAHITRIHPGI